jgi:hypothetical protein
MATQQHSGRFFYGWIIVAGAWVMYMLNQAAFTWGFSVFVNPLGEAFGWSRTSITVAWDFSRRPGSGTSSTGMAPDS